MTLLSSIGIASHTHGTITTPCLLTLSDITLVMPDYFSPQQCPAEIVVVDNLSHPPVEIPPSYRAWGLPVHVLVCSRPGAAAARNLGAHQARTPWVLFLDSDCLPDRRLSPSTEWVGRAYAGVVRAAHNDWLSGSCDTQAILSPPPLQDDEEKRPNYVITANTLVWRAALAQLGGFDERFPSAAGEDIDLGMRLWQIGSLSYAHGALVLHRFEPTILDFLRRFLRYGQGNRYLSVRCHIDVTPRPFLPVDPTWLHRLLSGIQYAVLWWRYHTTRPQESWKRPSAFPAWSRSVVPEAQQKPMARSGEVAVLIDGDCISPKWIAAFGTIAVGLVCHSLPTARRSWEAARALTPWSLDILSGNPDDIIEIQAERLLVNSVNVRRFLR